ncbi:unnamed protein product [Mesocestoides corti]|uniref:Similar to n=1 Tax=Mesocestoides corti TaxID=53468 RepID=A0A0R3URJ5_MESCO|nr:unnamed protein product [Mesocestoides corti]
MSMSSESFHTVSSLAVQETQEAARRIIEASQRKWDRAAMSRTELDLRRMLLIAMTERNAQRALRRLAARASSPPSPPQNTHQSFPQESSLDSLQQQNQTLPDISKLLTAHEIDSRHEFDAWHESVFNGNEDDEDDIQVIGVESNIVFRPNASR